MRTNNSIEETINSKKIIKRKKIKNRFLKWNVLKSQLTNEEKQILNSINKPRDFYICDICFNFPLITFEKVPENRKYAQNKYMLELTLEEHNFNKKPNEGFHIDLEMISLMPQLICIIEVILKNIK